MSTVLIHRTQEFQDRPIPCQTDYLATLVKEIDRAKTVYFRQSVLDDAHLLPLAFGAASPIENEL